MIQLLHPQFPHVFGLKIPLLQDGIQHRLEVIRGWPLRRPGHRLTPPRPLGRAPVERFGRELPPRADRTDLSCFDLSSAYVLSTCAWHVQRWYLSPFLPSRRTRKEVIVCGINHSCVAARMQTRMCATNKLNAAMTPTIRPEQGRVRCTAPAGA